MLRDAASDSYTLRGSATQFHNSLDTLLGRRTGPGLPKNASELAKQIAKCEEPLGKQGIEVEFRRPKHGRQIVLRLSEEARKALADETAVLSVPSRQPLTDPEVPDLEVPTGETAEDADQAGDHEDDGSDNTET